MKNDLPRVSLSDTEIIVLLKQNKHSSFGILYNKYWHPLMRYAMQYLNDTAASEDLVQELLIRFYKEECFLNIRTSLSSYLYAALRNRILNHLRKQLTYQKHLSYYTSHASVDAGSADMKIAREDFEKSIHHVVKGFPKKYQELYTLKYHHGLTLRKISSLLKRPLDTVEKQSRKVRSLLRTKLAKVYTLAPGKNLSGI